MFKSAAKEGQTNITGVLTNPLSIPVIYLVQRRGDLIAVGAMNTNYLRELGNAVAFGRRGHAAIVDRHGRVIAHPLDRWVKDRKDLSEIEPVQRMMNGETGISKFYSPALEDNMIAGFTTVAGPGWGVMIPQPFSELEAKANSVRLFALAVIMSGFLVSVAVAWFVTGYLIGPIAAMAHAAGRLADGNVSARAQFGTRPAPFELRNLLTQFNSMADTIQRNQVELENRVEERTRELQQREQELRNTHEELERRIDERTQDLRASEKRFKDYADATADWFWEMDANLRFTYMSENVERIVGVPPEWHYGKTREQLLHDDYDRDVWADHLKTLCEHKPFRNFEYQRVGKDIEPKWLRASGLPVFDDDGTFIGYRGSGSDVTQQKQAERALSNSQEQYRLLTELSPDAVFVHVDGKIVFVNPAMMELMEVGSANQLTGMTAIDVIHPDDHDLIKRMRVEIQQKTKMDFQNLQYQSVKGKVIEVDASASLTTWDGQNAILVVARDVTARNQMERQLRHSHKMEAVGQLTGGVAHDFNNLLAVIAGNTEILQDDIGNNTQLTTIERAADRGAELTQRLLAFSRQQTLQPQAIDLEDLISGLLGLFQRTLGEQIRVLAEVPDEIWPALADPGQLENALLNLSINARDAMPEGGLLTISCTNIELQSGDIRASDEITAGEYVQITVRDTGAGMSDEVLEHAFEPFYTTKDIGAGSGLGLSMVYGFARQSGGDAVIDSEPGEGSEIRLFLPRAEVNAMSDKSIQSDELARGEEEVILVLEDEPDVREYVVAALERLGYRVLRASNGAGALRVLENEAGNIDLLLSDVVLAGGMSGPELADKAMSLYPELKVVFMSGYTAELHITDKIPGFDEALLNKPFKRAELARVIRETLSQ